MPDNRLTSYFNHWLWTDVCFLANSCTKTSGKNDNFHVRKIGANLWLTYQITDWRQMKAEISLPVMQLTIFVELME